MTDGSAPASDAGGQKSILLTRDVFYHHHTESFGGYSSDITVPAAKFSWNFKFSRHNSRYGRAGDSDEQQPKWLDKILERSKAETFTRSGTGAGQSTYLLQVQKEIQRPTSYCAEETVDNSH